MGIKINFGSNEAASLCKGLSTRESSVCGADGEAEAEKGREGMEREPCGVLRVFQL